MNSRTTLWVGNLGPAASWETFLGPQWTLAGTGVSLRQTTTGTMSTAPTPGNRAPVAGARTNTQHRSTEGSPSRHPSGDRGTKQGWVET